MRLVRCPTKCTAKLRAGECKRIPRDAAYLAGYYVGCPVCGMPQAIRPEDATILEEGLDPGETPRLTVSAVTCSRCASVFRIDADEVLVMKVSRAG